MDAFRLTSTVIIICGGWLSALWAADPLPETPMTISSDAPLNRTDEEWRQRLTPEQYQVLRRHGTEAAFCGGYTATKHHGPGTYHCAGCDAELFTNDTKFDSGTGWPSFFQPLPGRVASEVDRAYGMERKEVHCARCGGHLGHVFDDGPKPTGLRYCINAVSLRFVPATDAAPAKPTETATFAAGCFWGVQLEFDQTKGVISTRVGYTGGHVANATYKQVCGDSTGHAEAVEVVFDPAVINYSQLLTIFWHLHDPTQVDRQGPDYGSQYRSAVFYHSDAQKAAAETSKVALAASGALAQPVATEITKATDFWPAEDNHQKYLKKHGLTSGCHTKW